MKGFFRVGLVRKVSKVGGVLAVCGVAVLPAAWGQTAASQALTVDLSMEELIERVLAHNESVQIRLLELEINRRRYRAERGIFEPELVLGYDHQDNNRELTSQDFYGSRIGAPRTYNERNNLYNAGLESLVPTGARLRLGYSLRDLRNNQQITPYVSPIYTNGEYVSFAGLSVVQPLLKNAWMPVTLANIRLAAVSSEIAFQEYRRQLMLILSAAQAAYWNLYLAQEQMLSLRQSVALAESILQDNQARLQVGRGAEMEVLEAQAGLALRRSKQAEARQLFYEALNRLHALYAESVVTTTNVVVAVNQPEVNEVPLTFFEGWQSAFEWNPDYLIQKKKLIQEEIRLVYNRNQRLPQLDLKASYGLNGLGPTPGQSWDDLEYANYPSWSVGAEMRVPLGGGTKSRNELAIAKLRKKQALVSLKDLEVQIANSLDTSLQKARSARDDVRNYQTVVAFNEHLLQTRLEQLKTGKVESRKVLEVEAELLEARISLVEAKVRFRRALMELDLVQGSLLNSLRVDLTQRELEQRTAQMARRGDITDQQYAHFLREVQLGYQARQSASGTSAAARSVPPAVPAAAPPAVPPTPSPVQDPGPAPGLEPDAYERALQILREQPHDPAAAPNPRP